MSYTKGPWQIVKEKYAHYNGGHHMATSIFTEWHHPQLKGPLPIVSQSVGIGKEKHGAPILFTSISDGDARLISKAPEMLELLKKVAELEEGTPIAAKAWMLINEIEVE